MSDPSNAESAPMETDGKVPGPIAKWFGSTLEDPVTDDIIGMRQDAYATVQRYRERAARFVVDQQRSIVYAHERMEKLRHTIVRNNNPNYPTTLSIITVNQWKWALAEFGHSLDEIESLIYMIPQDGCTLTQAAMEMIHDNKTPPLGVFADCITRGDDGNLWCDHTRLKPDTARHLSLVYEQLQTRYKDGNVIRGMARQLFGCGFPVPPDDQFWLQDVFKSAFPGFKATRPSKGRLLLIRKNQPRHLH